MIIRSNQTLGLLAAGAAVGVVAGLLLAPYSGHESRSVVKRNIGRIYGSARRSKSRITGFRRTDSPNPSMAVDGPYPHS